MISVDEAMGFGNVRLTPDERSTAEELERQVDRAIIERFSGAPFSVVVKPSEASPKIIAEVGRRYGDSGWNVQVRSVIDDRKVIVGHEVIFSPERFGNQRANPLRQNNPPTLEAPPELPPPLPPVAYQTPYRQGKSSRPRVALVCDVRGWAFDRNMTDMRECLSDRFDFDTVYVGDWNKGTRWSWAPYDIIYELYHRNPKMGIPMDQALGSIRSQWFRTEKPGPPAEEDIALVNRYRAFHVSTRCVFDALTAKCPGVVYLTNPINVRCFSQGPPLDHIVAEWNGNARHKAADGRLIKHLDDVVVPSCEKAGVPLEVAEYNETEGPRRRRSFDEMPAFYHGANVALCASEYEGCSNSVMEAMASGLALITTDVGHHREMQDAQRREFGDSGILIVDASADAIAAALATLTPERARTMGEINRKEIEARWSWSAWADRYAEFLRRALP